MKHLLMTEEDLLKTSGDIINAVWFLFGYLFQWYKVKVLMLYWGVELQLAKSSN